MPVELYNFCVVYYLAILENVVLTLNMILFFELCTTRKFTNWMGFRYFWFLHFKRGILQSGINMSIEKLMYTAFFSASLISH